MKSEMKNGIALAVIILLIGIAILMPALFNQIFDSGMDSRMKNIDDGVYHIANSEEKSVQKRMEELSEAIGKKEIKTVSTKIFANDAMCRKVAKEYRKWAKILNENLDIYGMKFNLGSNIVIYDDMRLYWDYDVDISFYVCVGTIGDWIQGEKYEVTMYVDKDTYKILYMQIWNDILQKKVIHFWESWGKDNHLKYRLNGEKEQNMSAFLKKYYNVPEDKFVIEPEANIYHASLFENLHWEVAETPVAGMGFGICSFDTEYFSNVKAGRVSYEVE